MKRDVDASFKWTEIAAASRNKIAQYNLGYLYEKGDGVAVSRNHAIDWYTKAAIQGYVAAQHKLGDLYSSSDTDQAIFWYKRAGESGDEAARKQFAALSSIRVSEIQRQAAENREKEWQEENARQLERKRQEARDAEDEQSVSAYKAQLFGNLQKDINRSWAQAEAGSRGSSIEEDRAKAKRLSDFNDSISRMEADPNSDLNRDKRARERERAEAKRADSERAAKREAAKRVALADDEKRAADKSAQADAAANARKKQQADELKAQQEQEKQRLEVERRSQELRDAAERKRVAAAEEAKERAVKEREAQAEKQARSQYLQSIAAGTRLVATKCPDGEGKYYATGTRPRPKPEVVSCVDVRFRAYCPGSRQYSDGTAHTFVGMSGCFGDTYEITPTPPCKVDQVRIEVVEARECSN